MAKDTTTPADSGISADHKSQLAAALNSSGVAQRAEDGKRVPADDVRGNVLLIIEAATGIEREDMAGHKQLGDGLGIDSLSLVDIAVRLEEQFGFPVADEDVKPEQTIDELVEFIDSRRAKHDS